MNYSLKLLIKLSNCPNFATFFTPSMQKCRPRLGFYFASGAKSSPKHLVQFGPRWFGSGVFHSKGFLQMPWAVTPESSPPFLTEGLAFSMRVSPQIVRVHKNRECSWNTASTKRSSSWTGTETAVVWKRVYVGGWNVTALQNVCEGVSTQTNNVFMRRNALKCSNNV